VLTIHYPKSLMRPAIFQNLSIVVALGLLTLLIEIFIIRSVLQNQVAAPLARLIRATRLVGQSGKPLDKKDLPIDSGDEIGELANSFACMAARVHDTQEALESRVLQRTEELAVVSAQAQRANEAKSLFLANMSHEIRTPMNAIIGMTHLAQRTSPTPKQQGYLSKIDNAAKSLLAIINDILDFSKIEAGKLELEHSTFALDEVLSSFADIVGHKAEQKGIEIILAVDPDTPRHLVGDSLRLGQILINLVNNAVKFTEQGEIVISVKPEVLSDEQVHLRFSVQDTGIGMTPEQLAGLFQSFSQTDISTTRKYGGSGLGLAISKQLAELMGGRIWAESVAGQGSTFSFTATLGVAQEVSPTQHLALLGELRGKKILVVDDSDNVREALSVMLGSYDVKVQAVSSGQAALSALSTASLDGTPFDLVLMDWRMPGMDGIETSRRIKAEQTLALTPAILMVSAFEREEVMHQSDAAGLDGFLIKPVSESSLIDSITSLFCGHHAAPEHMPELSASSHLTGRRVLLVEDNAINRELAIELLADLGISVEIAVNGREGVARATTEEFDLVLMDIQMPEMDGLTATRLIRADERLRDLPVIAMTAQAMSGDREKSLEAGMNDHIVKPIDPKILTETLSKWMVASPAHPDGAQSAAQVATVRGGDELPEHLPPFDIPAALARASGKSGLLCKMLLSFHDTYADAGAELRRLIAEGKREEAMRLAHSLKGDAGTLEAVAVRDAASAVEYAFRANEMEALASLIDALEEMLIPAVAATDKLKRNKTAIPPSPSTVSFDQAEVVAMSAALRKLLSLNNTKARKLYASFSEKLRGCGRDEELIELEESLDKFDFSNARLALDRLMEKLDFPEAKL
ncbi:MAG TPA: response regulator, partial [Gallionella sp.]|nr:response regulator [Gallionella sp.]